MTKKTIAEQIVIMQGFAKGKSMRMKTPFMHEYISCSNMRDLAFNWAGCDYELVPEPVVMYYNLYKTTVSNTVYNNFYTAESMGRKYPVYIKTIKLVQAPDD